MKSVNYILRVNGIRHVACVETQTGAVITACPTLGGWYFRIEGGLVTRSSADLAGCLR